MDPIEEKHRKVMNSVADTLDRVFRGFGWMLLVFDWKDNGRMNYISNAKREHMVAATKELAAKLDTTTPDGVAAPMTQRYVHIKSGKSYWLRFKGKLESNGTPVAVYSSEDGETWVRPLDEFEEKFKLPQ